MKPYNAEFDDAAEGLSAVTALCAARKCCCHEHGARAGETRRLISAVETGLYGHLPLQSHPSAFLVR